MGNAAAWAEMVRPLRASVRLASRDRILFANWFLMTDWSSPTLTKLFAHGGVYSPGFGAFLGNLRQRD